MAKQGIQKVVFKDGLELKDVTSFDFTSSRESTAQHTINKDGKPQGYQHGSFNGTWTINEFVHEDGPSVDWDDLRRTKVLFTLTSEEGSRRRQLLNCVVNSVADTTDNETNVTTRTVEGMYLDERHI